jgi:hypothetical protein
MKRGDLFNRGEALAESWIRGNHTSVLDQILAEPTAIAAALAAIVANGLDQIFNEGPAFRSALADRATR